MDEEVPLVVPEINKARIHDHKGIIANPNCTTIIANMAVWPLHQAYGVRRMVMSHQALGKDRAA